MGIKDIMYVDKASRRTIFHTICIFGHLELLKFLESMMDRKEFVEHLFLPSSTDRNPIEYAFSRSNLAIIRYLFSIKEIQDRYKNNDSLIFRSCILLFGVKYSSEVSNVTFAELVLSALQITKAKVVQLLNYKHPKREKQKVDMYSKNAKNYHKFSILTGVLYFGSSEHLEPFVNFIGKD